MTTRAAVPEPASTGQDPLQGSITSRVISGSVWTLTGYGLSQVLRLASNLVFAKLLFPEAFALMALVSVFLQGMAMFSDLGIGASIIQSRHGENPAFLNTAWTIQVLRGFGLWIVSLICAGPFATLYEEPQLAALIPVAAIAAIISGFNSTKWFTSNRQIVLARITILEFVSQTIGIVAMVVWCFLSRSVWAMVFGGLIGTASKAILSHVAIQGERNRFTFDRAAAYEMTSFGRWVFVSSALSFLAGQIDRLMLGKFVPMAMLGLYSIALNLASLPPMVTDSLIGSVLFPLLAHHSRNDSKAYERALLGARRVILEGALFLLAGIALCSPAFFRILYDKRYGEAFWMAQLLVVPTWTWIMRLSVERPVLALGKSFTMALSNATSLVGKIAACYIGFRLAGLEGFILGLALGYLAGYTPLAIALSRRGTHVLKQDVPYTAFAIAWIGGALLVQHWAVTLVDLRWRTWTELGVAAVAVVPLGLRVLRIGKQALSRR